MAGGFAIRAGCACAMMFFAAAEGRPDDVISWPAPSPMCIERFPAPVVAQELVPLELPLFPHGLAHRLAICMLFHAGVVVAGVVAPGLPVPAALAAFHPLAKMCASWVLEAGCCFCCR